MDCFIFLPKYGNLSCEVQNLGTCTKYKNTVSEINIAMNYDAPDKNST